MYKIIALWSAPKASDVEAFEQYYREVHVPKATVVPGLRKIALTRIETGLEGAPAPDGEGYANQEPGGVDQQTFANRRHHDSHSLSRRKQDEKADRGKDKLGARAPDARQHLEKRAKY